MAKRTFLYDEHIKLKAKMVDFAGWSMPVQFTSIIEEHKNVRKSDVPAYTRLMGIGLLLIGVGTCLTGIINLAFQTGTGWIAFGIGFFAGIGLMIKAQMKYNGSLFS